MQAREVCASLRLEASYPRTQINAPNRSQAPLHTPQTTRTTDYPNSERTGEFMTDTITETVSEAKRYLLLTLFPEVVPGPCGIGVVGRAAEKGLIHFSALNLREYGEGKHRLVDDTPYGGGDGMVMKPEPLARAIEDARAIMPQGSPVILMSPHGTPFRQQIAHELAELPGLIMVCGRYEGIDERIRTHFVDREISLGDFVLSGGEAAALAILDAVARLIPGVLGNADSIREESFQRPFLEYPQYTRPPNFRDIPIPDVLLSGNHAHIRRWRLREALRATLLHRPDLLEHAALTPEEQKLLRLVQQEIASTQDHTTPPTRSQHPKSTATNTHTTPQNHTPTTSSTHTTPQNPQATATNTHTVSPTNEASGSHDHIAPNHQPVPPDPSDI